MSGAVVPLAASRDGASDRVEGEGGAPPYAELVTATHFSFLRGASNPADLILRAVDLGLMGIGIADRNTVAGVVALECANRWGSASRDRDTRRCPFRRRARLVFVDAPPIFVAYPTDRAAGRLTRCSPLAIARGKGDASQIAPIARLSGSAAVVLPESTATRAPARNPVSMNAPIGATLALVHRRTGACRPAGRSHRTGVAGRGDAPTRRDARRMAAGYRCGSGCVITRRCALCYPARAAFTMSLTCSKAA